jgi:glycosyltransferase involved in cell wall biosynthesis
MSTLPFVFSDILYIHTSLPVIVSQELHVRWERYSTGLMRAYSFPYKLLIGIFLDLFKSLIQKPILITNSKFTRQLIGTYLGTYPLVVYPPVETTKYMTVRHIPKKGNIVLTISRLEEIKNLSLIPKIARETKNAKFIILGSTAAASKGYISQLLREARAFGVENRIEVVQNANETSKKEILSRAKIYLHTMPGEYFGISIVEAMAAGLVPVVHQSGGPWLDILEESQGAYGYSYRSVDEAAHIINKLLEKEHERLQVSSRAIERSKLFDSERFKRSMVRIVHDRLTAGF